jgi:V8-like Glu-specific endopeptidase
MFDTSRRKLLAGTAALALSIAATATPALAVVPNENTTPDDIVDNDEAFRGVGMFFRADGFVCTGTLINPRTVLFAAHCVNDVPAIDFNTDNIPAAFSFSVNAVQGAVGGIDFRRRAAELPNEGTTAGGDSGGPLILNAANNTLSDEDLVIGVLSGGSRFFGPQPFGALGTTWTCNGFAPVT